MRESSRPYATYAAVFLLASVLVGLWMRAMLAWPAASGGMSFAFVRHAHSHLALFGWATPALFALVVAGRDVAPASVARHATLAHVLAALNVATFLSFAAGGYDSRSIVLSAAHVVLWVAFAFLLRSDAREARAVAGSGTARGVTRKAMSSSRMESVSLAFLIAAGASTIAPVINVALGTGGGWSRQLAVKLFLAMFVGGWVVLGAIAMAYRLVGAQRFMGLVTVLMAAGVPLTVFLHTTASPPAGWEWLLWAGRAGTALVGAASLAAAIDLLASSRRSPLFALGAGALALKGALELLVAGGIGLGLVGNPGAAVAYLHLVLLGVATPLLLQALVPGLVARTRTAVMAVGLTLMLVPVAALGWPWLLGRALALGLGVRELQLVATGGALVTTVAVTSLAAAVTWHTLQASSTLRRAGKAGLATSPAVRFPP